MIETLNQYAKIYSDPPERERIASRGIVIKNNKILLSYEKNTDVYMTPGGGLESGESLEECCIRELCEETGFLVDPIKKFLIFNEYCFETLFVSNYFICKITGESKQSLTEIEIEHGITPVWLDIKDALEIFGSYAHKREDIASLYLREFTVISKYLKMNGESK
jgi:ADP-ribose pyrophosphatase YjhB (NUDIX family)